MDFTNKTPNWQAEGTEPSDSLKTEGFAAGYKPPAAYFNWFWTLVSKCITELQEKLNWISENGYEHPTGSGYNHIPTGGAAGQILDYSADGTAKWATPQLPRVTASSNDGVAYTANIEGLTELKGGFQIIFVPNRTTSTQTPTLNVNGLGAVQIRRKISSGTGTLVAGGATTFFFANRPSLLVYDTSVAGKSYWIAMEFTQNSAQDLYGTVKIESGGTGAETAEEARENLGVEKARTKVTGTGAITFTVEDYKEYSYTNVTSLKMTGAAVDAHGFITFGSSSPSITVSGFTASSGDDIAGAAAGQVWEFSVYPHNGKSYIIWKKWSD